ncbi:MAG: HAD family hydrolase [Pseudomonadota bacterium]
MDLALSGWTIVFDLDGTLIDTAPDLIGTAQALLSQRGLAPVPENLLRPEISNGSRRMMATAFAHHGLTPDDAELDAVFADFLAHYRAHIADRSQPFPHIGEVLATLKAAGAKLAVCTNKAETPALELLELLNMRATFDFIAGRDTFPVCKPNPAHLTETIARAGGAPERAIMVGDSETDAATAQAAGIPIIAVTFGYTSVPVQALGCDAVIDSYTEFMPALAALIAASNAPEASPPAP